MPGEDSLFDGNNDPFSIGNTTDDSDLVHIRIQQRNGRKSLTTVQGLSDKYDKKKLTREFKRLFACNGTVVEHAEYGEVIQMQGDQRNRVKNFLVDNSFADESKIKVHGF
ncbi:hypothetical protein SNEBB_000245 [Seison nebaliae]|nr:hypothetical protein SNEBB_000245 [Seison nebaliae]